MEQVDRMWEEHLKMLNRAPYTISPAAREKAMALRRDHEVRRQIQYIDAVSEKCFDICVGYPRGQLLDGQKACLVHCSDQWFQTQQLLGQKIVNNTTEGLRELYAKAQQLQQQQETENS